LTAFRTRRLQPLNKLSHPQAAANLAKAFWTGRNAYKEFQRLRSVAESGIRLHIEK